jgi:hypothetical protein
VLKCLKDVKSWLDIFSRSRFGAERDETIEERLEWRRMSLRRDS